MMKFTIVTWNTILFFSILAICSSCNGQNISPAVSSSFNGPNPKTTIGDTVSEMDNHIMYVFQDKNNNYWFGSDTQGVYRYNPSGGKYLIRFTHKDGLCKGRIRGIQEDKSGNLYFNTAGGISKFDGHTLTKLKITKTNLPNDGWRLHPDDLWFQGAQDSGVVYRYDGTALHRLQFPKTKAFEDFIATYPRAQYPQMTFSPYDVYGIYRDRRGNVWFGTNIGLCRYGGKNFDWMSEEELGIDDISFHVRSIIEDKKGKFWFTNTMHRFDVYRANPTRIEKGSIPFKKEKGIINSKDHDAAYFLSGIEDSKGDLWMVTYNKGVWRYDGKQLTNYQVKDGDENVTLFTIYKDHKGDLWLGTHATGAYKFNGKAFEKFRL